MNYLYRNSLRTLEKTNHNGVNDDIKSPAYVTTFNAWYNVLYHVEDGAVTFINITVTGPNNKYAKDTARITPAITAVGPIGQGRLTNNTRVGLSRNRLTSTDKNRNEKISQIHATENYSYTTVPA